MKQLAKEFHKLTWLEMEKFAGYVLRRAANNKGKLNDEQYMAHSILAFADEVIKASTEKELLDKPVPSVMLMDTRLSDKQLAKESK